ncbi:MAG TPA: BLUF domain-containing protein [Beijerinckiaceae bacterium]|jgi:hypothetical protein
MATARISLFRLLFFSRNKLIPSGAERQDGLAQIVRNERKKNEFAVITSYLVVDGPWFVQVLEGERSAVHDAFQRVAAEPHHSDVLISEWREVSKREFLTSLGCTMRAPETEAIFARHNLTEALDRGTPKPGAMLNLMLALQANDLAKQGINAMLV